VTTPLPSEQTPGPDHSAPEYETVAESTVEPKTRAAAYGAGGSAVVATFINYLIDVMFYNGEQVPPDVPLAVTGVVYLAVVSGGAFAASYLARHVNR